MGSRQDIEFQLYRFAAAAGIAEIYEGVPTVTESPVLLIFGRDPVIEDAGFYMTEIVNLVAQRDALRALLLDRVPFDLSQVFSTNDSELEGDDVLPGFVVIATVHMLAKASSEINGLPDVTLAVREFEDVDAAGIFTQKRCCGLKIAKYVSFEEVRHIDGH